VTANEIREMFLRFFEEKGHKRVRSSSLVPVNDPTLLFTNAGMNQFKDVFLGLDKRDYSRAVTCQKCVRAGGKHNDLENVGFTNRHHTFFEMLGNFSFGDYYKKDAIAFAWDLLTSEKWFAIPKDRLYVTIFEGSDLPDLELPRDVDAESEWQKVGVPRERIFASGIKDNFWQMGETGPCGPCSEIHFDMGSAASEIGPHECTFPHDCGRYLEVWNLVFMQYNREPTGSLAMLPKPSVDTGMGLERIAAVLRHLQDPSKVSNYDTDLFTPLIKHAGELTRTEYGRGSSSDASLRIISDHARATAFLIADGVMPSNEGRGYVLRKIMRRAMRHARLLGADRPVILTEMVFSVRKLMSDVYEELWTPRSAHMPFVVHSEERDFAANAVKVEEERFARTLAIGLRKLDEDLAPIVEAFKSSPNNPAIYDGERAFRLYDTYGLPLDFIVDAARDVGVLFDEAQFRTAFNKAMAEQRTRARASWKGAHKEVANPIFAKLAETYKTEPDFYYGASTRDCKIEAIIAKGASVKEIPAGAEAEIVLDRTSIYSESGGQVADTGKFCDNSESMELADVTGAYYPVARLIAHRIVAKETLRVGDRVATVADAVRREHIKRNHTATHLMHAALRNILGTHVKQAGSLVEPGRLRFDFSHFAPVDAAELRDIEQQVNEEILLNNELETGIMPLDEALASGALAFFGDRYPESNVRVVTIPDAASSRGFYSKELCGGTHVRRSGDIGVFKIIVENSVAAGVRRIEAISGVRALEEFQKAETTLRAIASTLNAAPEDLQSAAQKLLDTRRDLEKQLGAVQRKAAQGGADDLLARARDVKGVRVISAQVGEMNRDALRGLVDTLRQKLGSGVIVLGMVEDGKVALISGVTKDLTSKLQAGKIIQSVAKEVGGSGGGRPDLAEAGGKDAAALETALEHVFALIDRML
jgi:alanyl-tRNA synthetase